MKLRRAHHHLLKEYKNCCRSNIQLRDFSLDLASASICSGLVPGGSDLNCVFSTVGQLMCLHVGTLKLAVMLLRKMSSKDLTERTKLEHLYNTVQVFTKNVLTVVKPVVVPLFFTVGATVVFLIYFPLKHPELPGMLIAVFIGGVSLLMGVVMTGSVDLVKSIRASEELIGEIQSIRALPSDFSLGTERMALLKTAKAYRPLNVPFGAFADFSLDVPIVMWEEVINQLLFLLSF